MITTNEIKEISEVKIPILNRTYENLRWDKNFKYDGLVRLYTIGDGSCFFHAVIKAYFIPYKVGYYNEQPLDRGQFIRNFRRDLAKTLREDPEIYKSLSRGQLENMSKTLEQCHLEEMIKVLDSDLPVDNLFNEYVSNVINKDIYLLDMEKEDVYMTGNDIDILYKNRDSIVILTMPGHYELVGVERNGLIQTLFRPNDDFILYIKERLHQLTPI